MEHTSLNRNAIILLPKQPALDWIMRVDQQPMPNFTLEDLRKMFQEWFEVQYHSTIWDLSGDPLEHESWD